MTKIQLVQAIIKDCNYEIDEITASRILESFMEVVKDALPKGKNIYLRGFASFITVNYETPHFL